jgi:hypothetical protein
MDSEKVIKRLQQLHMLATLRPGEEKDEGRANEARNAAFLLLKTAQDNGFEVQFVSTAAMAGRKYARDFADATSFSGSAFESVMQDLFGGMERDLRQQKPPAQAGKVITARYAGFCRKCGKGYKAKERVVWISGETGSARRVGSTGALHVACAR